MSAGTNNLWNHVTSLVAGLLARADDVNTHLDAIAEGFDATESELDKCIQITGAGMTTFDISGNAAARISKIVGFDATGAEVALVTNPSEEAEAWATTTGALVEATDYSAKEYAIGTFVPEGSAKQWAMTAEDTLVDATDYSARHWAAKAAAATAAVAAALETGTFTLTGGGFSGTAPSVTAAYALTGGVCTLYIPTLAGTSNATVFTLTGIPPALVPSANRAGMICRVMDNGGAHEIGVVNMYASGSGEVIRLSGSAFTASGTKQLVLSTITYPL